MKNLLAEFHRLINDVDAGEAMLKETKRLLKEQYERLVQICPHSEAVDRKSTIRGMGTTRRCKICGITDYSSEGGTPGDEYDYGYPGYPSRSFWAEAEVEEVSEKDFNRYDRYHDWIVSNGKAKRR